MICLRDVSLLAVAALIGCSPVVDPSNSPDAQIDAPDTTAPGIASSNVQDMGARFSVIHPIVISFDEDLDPATVSATSVTLTYDALNFYRFYEVGDFAAPHGPVAQPLTRVRGTVAYDAATRKLTFTPAVPLAYGQVHTLRLVDLKDTNGNAFSETISFRTFVNSVVRRTYFSTSGATQYYYRTPVDANGYLDKQNYVGNTGPDAMWFSMDDIPGDHFDLTYDAAGRLRAEAYLTSGPDNRYDTADDTIIEFFGNVIDASGKQVERYITNNPGVDAMYGTADDVPIYLMVQNYTGDRHTGFIWYTNSGTDTLWRTADDRCNSYWEYEYDAQGNKTRETRKRCNGDQLPRTADDTINQIRDYAYDSEGRLTRLGYRVGPGTDTMWDTADDAFAYILRTDYDASGLAIGTLQYSGPGTDGVWGTPDDTASYATTTIYDTATKLPLSTTTYGEDGADNMWGTPDDMITGYQVFTYDGLGNRTDEKYFDAGADGMWRTPDDRVLQDNDYNASL